MNVPPVEEVHDVFEAHAPLVWRVLARSGVRDDDLRDASQEVFIVVLRKLQERDRSASLTTWLYGIAVRVAANYRRKAHRRHEDLTDEPPERARESDPEIALGREQARLRLASILDQLPMDERNVFFMFELEEMPCPAIAEALGLPLGTVYTRLRSARARFEAAATRSSRKERR